jgi:hypothetical protein
VLLSKSIPVAAVFRRPLRRRAARSPLKQRGILSAGIASACVLALMLCMAALPTSHAGSGRGSRRPGSGKLLRCLVPDDVQAEGLGHASNFLHTNNPSFQQPHTWTVISPPVPAALSSIDTKSMPTRAPPFS